MQGLPEQFYLRSVSIREDIEETEPVHKVEDKEKAGEDDKEHQVHPGSPKLLIRKISWFLLLPPVQLFGIRIPIRWRDIMQGNLCDIVIKVCSGELGGGIPGLWRRGSLVRGVSLEELFWSTPASSSGAEYQHTLQMQFICWTIFLKGMKLGKLKI